jgi:hypothetical protein
MSNSWRGFGLDWIGLEKSIIRKPNPAPNARISYSAATLSSPDFLPLFVKLHHIYMNKENYRWVVTIRHWKLWRKPNDTEFSFPLYILPPQHIIFRFELQSYCYRRRKWIEKENVSAVWVRVSANCCKWLERRYAQEYKFDAWTVCTMIMLKTSRVKFHASHGLNT